MAPWLPKSPPPELGVEEPPPNKFDDGWLFPEVPEFPKNPPEGGAVLVELPPNSPSEAADVVAALFPPDNPPPAGVGGVEEPPPLKRPPLAGLLAF